MDVSLLATLIGTVASVVAVPVAILQLRQSRKKAHKAKGATQGGYLSQANAGPAVGQDARVVLPPPVGRLPAEVRGREGIVKLLSQLAASPDGRFHVLAGLGGSGKSTVALAVGRRVAAVGQRTCWVPVTDPGSVTSVLLGLARKLGAPDGEVTEALAGRMNASDVLWPRLEATPGWVLVLDNADDAALLATGGRPAHEAAGWLRPTRAGLVLVTSRTTDPQVWGPMASVHPIDPLNGPDGGQVLLDLAPDAGDDAHAAGLSARLGGLPLALHQAGAYLASPFAAQRTFEAYSQALVDRFDHLLGRGDDDRARVTGTWELSLSALDTRGCPQARDLLRVLSCFAPATPIPPSLLNHDALATCTGGSSAAEDGLSGLLAAGLIATRDGIGSSQPSVVVHPLVAELTRRQAGAGLDASFAQAVRLLDAAAGQLNTEDPADRTAWQALLPHLHFLLTVQASADNALLAELVGNAARASAALSWTGAYLAAFEVADAVLARAACLDSTDDSVLALRLQRAITSRFLGHTTEATTDFEEVLSARLKNLGPEHPDTLTAQHYAATNVGDQGRLAEAEARLRQVLAKKLKVLGPDHPSTLATRHQIAAVLSRQGMPAEAEAESRLVLDARKKVLGPEHPSTLATLHDVAHYLAEQGKASEAEPIFRQALSARSRVLPADHPRILETRYGMAMALAAQGKREDAMVMLHQVHQAQTRVLGPGHPDTLRTQSTVDGLKEH